MTKARVLIAGSTGLLGKVLTEQLSNNGFTVLAHGCSHEAHFQADLTDGNACRALLRRTRPDTIVNLVALTDVDRCEKEPARAHALNVSVADHLAQGVKERLAGRLIQISSDMVYSGVGPHLEETPVPLNTYAWSKLCGEYAASCCDATVLRCNFFGPSSLPWRQSFSDWAMDVVRNDRPVKLFRDVYFSPLYMTTLCSCIEMVLDCPRSGVYNVGSKRGITKENFVRTIAMKLGCTLKQADSVDFASFPSSAHRPLDMRLQVDAFEKQFGVELPDVESEIEILIQREEPDSAIL